MSTKMFWVLIVWLLIFTIPASASLTWADDNQLYRIDNYIAAGSRPYVLNISVSNSCATNTATTLYTCGLSRTDFRDVRFYLDNTTALSYYNYTALGSTTTKFWVNVTSNGVVNMYFGDKTGTYTTQANGDNTFLQFKGATTAGYLQTTHTAVPFIYETRMAVTTDGTIQSGVGDGAVLDATANSIFSQTSPAAASTGLITRKAAAQSQNIADPKFTADSYYDVEIVAHSTSDIRWVATGYAARQLTTNIPTVDTLSLGVRVASGAYLQNYSFVRQLASPEPVFATWGGLNVKPTFVANWTMNESTGNYINDTSEFFNNGTLSGIAKPTWATNLVNGSVNSTALQLGGRGNVNITTSQSLNFTTDMSFFGWIKPADLTAYDPMVIIAKDDSNTKRSWALRLNGAIGTLSAFVVDNTGAGHSASNGAVTKDTWQYVGFTVNSSGQIINLYHNNAVVGTTAFTGTIKVTDTNISIGSLSDNLFDAYYYNGTVDEFKLYDYVLNTSEITALYQQFQPVPAYPVGGLVINPTSTPQSITFSWHDTVYPQDELIIATDIGFTNIVHDAFYAGDTATISLPIDDIYYWKVRQFNSGTGSYGNTSAIQTFTLGTLATFLRVNVFDELNQSPVQHVNITLISVSTNVSVNQSSTSTNNWVNFTNPQISGSVEYLAQVSALNFTTRNILLTSPGNYSVYLPYAFATTGISLINFVESDYTGLFPYQTTRLIVKKIINTTVVNISSDYFDATGVSPSELINGQSYQLYVQSGTSIRSLGGYIPSASGSQTLLIADFNLAPSSQFNGLVYNFTYSGNTSIVLQWSDPNNEIISLNETISNQQGTLVYQVITGVHSGQTTYLIANKSSKYLVQLTILTTSFSYLNYNLWYNPTLYNSTSDFTIPQPAPNNYIVGWGNVSNMSTTSNDNAPIPIWVKNIIGIFPGIIILMVSNRNTILRNAPIAVGITGVMWLTGFFLITPLGYAATGGLITAMFVVCIMASLSEGNKL